MFIILLYVVSVLVSGAGAIWLLRTELAEDRRRIQQGYGLEVTWLKIVAGVFVVLLPIFNTILMLALIAVILDRPVITKARKS